jgi:hypothetical protein
VDGGIARPFFIYKKGLSFKWKYCKALLGLWRRFKFWMEILQGPFWLIVKVQVHDDSIVQQF